MLHFHLLVVLVPCLAQTWSPALQDSMINGKLLQIYVFYRNGHIELQNDLNEPELITDSRIIGPTQLSKLGMEQAFEFGKKLRKRYRALIPEEHAWKYVNATSSYKIRALKSSAEVLAGLMPPTKEDQWSAIINTDNYLSLNIDCPRFELLYLLKNSNFDQTDIDNLYEYVSENSKREVRNPADMLVICTRMEILRQAGKALPKWVIPIYEYMKREAVKSFQLLSLEATRLRVGPILKTITSFNIKDIKYPIYLHCTHVIVIGALIRAFNLTVTEPPNFMSAIVIEYREVKGNVYVQIWYRTGPYEELTRYKFSNCGFMCPIERLQEMLNPLVPDDWKKECIVYQGTQSRISILVLTIVVVVLLVVALVLCCPSQALV